MNRTTAGLDSAQDPGKFQKVLFVIGPMHPAPIADGVRLHGRQAVHHAITEVCLAINGPISAWMIAEGAMQQFGSIIIIMLQLYGLKSIITKKWQGGSIVEASLHKAPIEIAEDQNRGLLAQTIEPSFDRSHNTSCTSFGHGVAMHDPDAIFAATHREERR